MALTRQTVLELISSGKYHSCLFTTYSFDFSFFELRVMRALRSAGVKNVMVLLDAKVLQKLALQPSGFEFVNSSGYTIHPIYANGVFHPKIALLFGKKDGLLIIGSGNLTASGLGNNDEVWTAFHLTGAVSPNAGIFSDAWEYVQKISENIKGINAEKLQWIRQYTPWLKDLPSPAPGTWYQLEQDVSAAFIANTNAPILITVTGLIGDKQVKTITAVSPFYDLEGEVLSQLYYMYQGATIKCVIEDRYGTAPVRLKREIADNISVYTWESLFPDDTDVNRLHAKLLHFDTTDGEYMLIGSANNTAAAMGGAKLKPINEEANILLYRKKGPG